MSLTIALDRVDFLPANRVTDNAAILTLKSLVFEPLCKWTSDGVRPGLLAHCSSDALARLWRLTLRPGACFHDGQRCTAGDVIAFIEAILASRDMFGMPWSYARYFDGARFTLLSDDVIGIETPTSFADLPEVLAEFYPCREDAAGRPVVGTGPYRVMEFEAGIRAVLEPLGGGQRLSMVAIPHAETRLAALRGDQPAGAGALRLDVACGLEQMHGIADFALDLGWAQATSTLSVMAYLNADSGRFTDPALRLAANLAVNKTWLAAGIFGGLATPASTVVSPFHFGHAQSGCTPVPYAPDEARRLLDAAGGAAELHIRTPDHMPERAPELAAAIAAALDAVGFRTSIETQHDRPEYAREVGRKQMGDLALFDSSPNSTFRVLDDKISSVSRGVWWQGYRDAEVDNLIAQACRTPDDVLRASIYGRCLARLNAAPPWLYLLHPTLICAWRRGCGSYSLDHRGVLQIGRSPA